MKENKIGAEELILAPEEMNEGSDAATMSHAATEMASATSTCCECLDSNTMETAFPLTIEQSYGATICCPECEHWYRFTADENTTYTVYSPIITGGRRVHAYVYDENDCLISPVSERIGGLSFKFKLSLTAGKTYYVCVSPDDGVTGTYFIKVTKDILVDSVSVLPQMIVLKKGETYLLPRDLNAALPTNIARIPCTVALSPVNVSDTRIFWDEIDENMFDLVWDHPDYMEITPKQVGATTMYVSDWNEHAELASITMIILDEEKKVVRVNAAGGVILKKFPNECLESVGTVANGTQMVLLSETPINQKWYNVYTKKEDGTWTLGWCSGEYIGYDVEYVYLKSTDNWFVRKDHQMDSNTLVLLESGSFAKLLKRLYKEMDGYYWYEISYQNYTGYVPDTIDSLGRSSNYIFVTHWESLVNPQPPYAPTVISADCLDFIKNYEGLVKIAQDDGYGNLTIGYGHVVEAGETTGPITEEVALDFLNEDLRETQIYVSNCSKNRSVIWNQQEFDAFVSLAFNAGTSAAQVMDMIVIDKEDPYSAFGKITKASNGQFSLGLYRRRMDEADIFVEGDYTRQDRIPPVG